MPATIDHAVLRVSDLDAAIAFYTTLFSYAGWKVVDDPADERSLGFRQQNGFTIWLIERRDMKMGPALGALDHLALHCASQEDVNNAYDFCIAQKWTIISEPQPYPAYENFYGFSFEGPDALRLEFVTR